MLNIKNQSKNKQVGKSIIDILPALKDWDSYW